jgi:hypothetical protein
VRRFDRWRAFVAALAALAAATLAAWFGTRLAWGTVATAVATLASCALAVAIAWHGSRRAPVRLRWDGFRWHLGPAAAASDQDVAGCSRPIIDLGSWLLVVFEGSTSAVGRVWLPLQRRGLEGEWHALRCALYAVPSGGAAAARGNPSDAGVGRPIE